MRIDRWIRHLLVVLLAAWTVHTANGQESDLAPVSDTYAITNAVIIQGPGRTIPNGTILISNGLIKSVGTSVEIPSNALVIDADSMFVYPGFIDGLSQAGIPRNEEEQRPRDVLSQDPPYKWAGITPEISAADLIDASDNAIGQLREAGFTMSQVVPRGRMLSGQGAILLLSGEEGTEMVYRENTTQYARLSGARGVFPSTVIGVMAKMRDIYRNAEYARLHTSNYSSNPSGMERPQYDPVLQALFPVTSGNMTITYEASDDLAINRILTLQKDLGFRLVLAGVESGWPAIDKIRSSGSQVFLSIDLPKEFTADTTREIKTELDKELAAREKRKEEAYKLYAAQASAFHRAGIRFGFSTLGERPGDLKKNLSTMIEYGLPEDAALAALTTNAAAILGVSDVAGSLDPGKLANLVVTTGPLFDEKSAIKYVFVDGDKYEYEGRKKPTNNGGGEGTVVLAGSWNYTADDGDGQSEGVITFVQDGDSYSGTMSNTMVPVSAEVSDVSINGNEVSFVATFSMDGQNFEVEATVYIDGNSMDGSLTTPFGEASIRGEKNPNN